MDVLAAKWHSTFGMSLDNTRLDILDTYPLTFQTGHKSVPRLSAEQGIDAT